MLQRTALSALNFYSKTNLKQVISLAIPLPIHRNHFEANFIKSNFDIDLNLVSCD